MGNYMEKYFGKYTEEDLKQGRETLAGGSVGKSEDLLIVDQTGATFTDQHGKEYIDCTSQAWSLNIGGGRQEIIDVVSEQVQHTMHVRSGYGTIPKFLLSKRLADIAPGNLKKVSYCLHGSVANEGAMKLAMRNKPNRMYFLTPWRGFAGRTLATIAMTWPHPNNQFLPFMGHAVRFPNAYCYRCPFENHYPGCNFECARFLRKTIENSVDGKPIAILMEPMQAAGGMITYPDGYLQEIRKICDELDILLIFDEIQTAFGRMGRMFVSELYGVLPDIMTFGKAIGGGFPLAGSLHRTDLVDFGSQDHGFTFASFPVSMAAGIVTLEILRNEKLPERSEKMGNLFLAGLEELKNKYELLGDVRGHGLMIGIELVKNKKTKEPALDETGMFIEEGTKRGVLFGRSTYPMMSNVVKIKPPLVISEAQVEQVLKVFKEPTEAVSQAYHL